MGSQYQVYLIKTDAKGSTGVEDAERGEVRTPNRCPTVIRSRLLLPETTGDGRHATGVLIDALGRGGLELRGGANDVRALAPGVYFVREALAQARAKPSARSSLRRRR